MKKNKYTVLMTSGLALSMLLAGCGKEQKVEDKVDKTEKVTTEKPTTEIPTRLEALKAAHDKYTKDEPVNKDKSVLKKPSAYLVNADGKVLYQSSSIYQDLIGQAAGDLNTILNENVYIQAQEGGRVDAVVVDDKTPYSTSRVGEKNSVGKIEPTSETDKIPMVVNTDDHRLIVPLVLFNEFKGSTTGDMSRSDDITQQMTNAMARAVGITVDVSNKKNTEIAREQFRTAREKALKDKTFNTSLTSEDTEITEVISEPENITFKTTMFLVPQFNKFKEFSDISGDLTALVKKGKKTNLESTLSVGNDMTTAWEKMREFNKESAPLEDNRTISISDERKTILGKRSTLGEDMDKYGGFGAKE